MSLKLLGIMVFIKRKPVILIRLMKYFNRNPYTCTRCGNMLNYLLEMTEG